LKALLDSIKLVNSTLDLNVVLDNLMELAKKATGSEASSALLIEGDKTTLRRGVRQKKRRDQKSVPG